MYLQIESVKDRDSSLSVLAYFIQRQTNLSALWASAQRLISAVHAALICNLMSRSLRAERCRSDREEAVEGLLRRELRAGQPSAVHPTSCLPKTIPLHTLNALRCTSSQSIPWPTTTDPPKRVATAYVSPSSNMLSPWARHTPRAAPHFNTGLRAKA